MFNDNDTIDDERDDFTADAMLKLTKQLDFIDIENQIREAAQNEQMGTMLRKSDKWDRDQQFEVTRWLEKRKFHVEIEHDGFMWVSWDKQDQSDDDF